MRLNIGIINFLVNPFAKFNPDFSDRDDINCLTDNFAVPPIPVVTSGFFLRGFLISIGLPAGLPPVVVTSGFFLRGFLISIGLSTPRPPVVVTLGVPPFPGFGFSFVPLPGLPPFPGFGFSFFPLAPVAAFVAALRKGVTGSLGNLVFKSFGNPPSNKLPPTIDANPPPIKPSNPPPPPSDSSDFAFFSRSFNSFFFGSVILFSSSVLRVNHFRNFS